MVIPKHLFEPYRGARSREAPSNLAPCGAGPYRGLAFNPGDMIRAEINLGYHVVNRPFFDTLELKGGGDAVSAARAVMQTGEYDLGWNMQVDDDLLRRLEQGGRGHVVIVPAGNPEHIQLNQTDPRREVDGERSSIKTVHPFLTDPALRSALPLLADRATIQEQIYGRQGQATANFLNAPARFASPNLRWEFIRMNDLVVQSGVVIPIVARNGASAVSNQLRGVDFSSWSGTLWKLAYWYREP